jgi:hypothetical protein
VASPQQLAAFLHDIAVTVERAIVQIFSAVEAPRILQMWTGRLRVPRRARCFELLLEFVDVAPANKLWIQVVPLVAEGDCLARRRAACRRKRPPQAAESPVERQVGPLQRDVRPDQLDDLVLVGSSLAAIEQEGEDRFRLACPCLRAAPVPNEHTASFDTQAAKRVDVEPMVDGWCSSEGLPARQPLRWQVTHVLLVCRGRRALRQPRADEARRLPYQFPIGHPGRQAGCLEPDQQGRFPIDRDCELCHVGDELRGSEATVHGYKATTSVMTNDLRHCSIVVATGASVSAPPPSWVSRQVWAAGSS